MDDETHHKVDPKEERIRRVEARAASEPFGAKRHPANIEKKKGKTINASSNQCINHHHPIPGICHSVPLPAKKNWGLRGKGHVPAIELSCAEHDNPIMPRGVTLHDLVYDESGKRRGAKHGQYLERDNPRVCRSPTRVGSGVFAPCAS